MHVRWLGFILGLGLVVSCSDDNRPAADASTDTSADTRVDAADSSTIDALADGGDAATDSAMDVAANSDATTGTLCSFNRDCSADHRCECDEVNGCSCQPGMRGTGRGGVDACTDSNDCASAVCVEGPPDMGFFCSNECMEAGDCMGMLPECVDVALVGRICVRTPPDP